jgi:DNA-binding CsgD family transcriptional regulator
MWDSIQRFIEGLNEETTEEGLFSRLEVVAADLGYPYYAFGALWGDPEAYEGYPAPAVRLNYPKDWVEHYFLKGYEKVDPVVMVAPYAQTSITWDELREYRPEFFDEAAGYGLRAGISIPLRAIQGAYILCLASDQTITFTPALRSRLEVMAYGFFSAYLRLRHLQPADHGMTPNTVEVIRLSMAGLSPQEIAKRLGLSSHGVYWCIKDAKKKLKCANQAQVYLKAIQQGIVTI